jgi:hypothetical protein
MLRAPSLALLAAASIALTAGCSHKAGDAASTTASAAAPGPRVDEAASALGDEPDEARARSLPPASGEAARSWLLQPEDEPALAPFADRVRAHFEGTAPGRLALQMVRAGGSRVALLVTGEAGRKPLVIVTDETGTKVEWTKERPLAGTQAGGAELALVPGPRGQVALAWYDEPTHIVALRRWHPDGQPLGDFHLLDVDACSAISALYWPGRGYWVVAAQPGFARAQVLDEAGMLPWGRDGRNVAAGVRAGGAVSLALDLDVSVILVQLGHPGGPPLRNEAPHLLATRFDDTGARLWPEPVDLGPVEARAERDRPAVTRARLGSVHVVLGPVDAELGSTGSVRR